MPSKAREEGRKIVGGPLGNYDRHLRHRYIRRLHHLYTTTPTSATPIPANIDTSTGRTFGGGTEACSFHPYRYLYTNDSHLTYNRYSSLPPTHPFPHARI
eukprot:EG_transcript_26244